MLILPEAMAAFATGCQSWLEHDGSWRAVRMPKNMQTLYVDNHDANRRMLCTSGVRLRFESDTTKLHVALVYGLAVRRQFKCVLLVNGQPMHDAGFGPEHGDTTWQGVIFENPKKQKRTFDLWLPHCAQVDVTSLEVDDNCVIQPALALPLKWLIYGGSITQGMESTLPTNCGYPPVALKHDIEMYNLALGGAKCEKELASLVPDGDFDLVSIAYGTNDFIQGHTTQQYHDYTRGLAQACLAKFKKATVFVLTPTHWVGRTEPNKNGNHLQDFRDALTPLGDMDERVKLIDGKTLVPNEAEMFIDMVHPNDKGFAHFSRVLGEHVQAAIAGKS